jgi:hypothetical protein
MMADGKQSGYDARHPSSDDIFLKVSQERKRTSGTDNL